MTGPAYTCCMVRTNILAAVLLVASASWALAGLLAGPSSAAEPQKAPGSAQLAAPITGLPRVTFPNQWAQQTASTLTSVDAPGRDLISITQRLKLNGVGNIPTTVNSAPPNYAAGSRQQFYVADIASKNYHSINATLKVVTGHAYWYVGDDYRVNQQALASAAQYFEDHVYPTDRRVFGSEPFPGIDDDPHITVLMTTLPGLNGYFSASDAYPRVVNPYSNQRKMIYIATHPQGNPASPTSDFEGTLAHEFQHMIHSNVHKDREVWLDEGCSEVAMYLNAFNPGGFDFQFTNQPDVQLNAWSSEPGLSGAHYGASYLFLRYLMDRYGGESFMSKLVKEHGLGVDAIDAAVKQSGNIAGFEGAFKDWTIANSLNNGSIAGGRYSYAEGGRAQDVNTARSYPASYHGTVHQYAADYIKLSGNLGTATISFQGSPTAKVIAADPHSGQGYWYSNRRDSGDATLTREVDLSHASRATLQFWTWYDIETAFDYAYIETSLDGGRSWTTLRGKYTTTANPNGASFGNAWTGKSGVSGSSSALLAKWVQESVDLSPYAGKRVQVRFEYITDEGYNGPGFAVDDLRIAETGYSDNAESDNGWDARGFARIGNTIPERWYVALIENGSTPRVRELTVSPTGSGTLDIEGFGQGKAVRDATLVIAPMAPKTTETADYSVTVRKR
jgi:immune inhibitor A